MIDTLPPQVRLVRDFVNTAEPQLGTDRLVAATAVPCLHQLGLATADVELTAEDLALLIGVREGLREVLTGHAGHDTSPSALREVNSLLGTVPVTFTLADRSLALSPVVDRPAHQALAAVLSAIITTPPQDWARLKVCARDSCRWAFYDASRNRSGRWCSMAGCGNIVKMQRAYRTRTGRANDAVDRDPTVP
jgi:predicted RNA-binding Zn ribbon-like protein